MSVAVISDLHIHNFRAFGGVKVSGINYRCHLALLSLCQAVSIANEMGCRDLVITGDIFDVSDPSPQIVAATIEMLQGLNGDAHVIAGNHDQFSTSAGDHALGPMDRHKTRGGKIYVYEHPQRFLPRDFAKANPDRTSLFVPFKPEPVADWLPALLKEHSKTLDTVYAHFGIIDDHTPKYLRAAPDAYPAGALFELMKKHNVWRFVVGNWHMHQAWRHEGREIIQVGALTPTGFNNLGVLYGKVVILEDGTKTRVREVTGPRFFKVRYPELDLAAMLKVYENRQHEIYLHVEAEPADLVMCRGLLNAQKARDEIKGFELVPNKEQAAQQARKAARATSQVSMTSEAASAFVGKMPLEEGVSREKVLSRVQQYLKR